MPHASQFAGTRGDRYCGKVVARHLLGFYRRLTMRVLRLVLAVCSLALPLTAAAAVQLPNLFSDHAVLQRDRPVRIWGWGRAAENVTVRFHGQTVTTQTDPIGYWEAWLKPEPAGGPYTLTVSGDSTATPLERKDILAGEVWLASGQSN